MKGGEERREQNRKGRKKEEEKVKMKQKEKDMKSKEKVKKQKRKKGKRRDNFILFIIIQIYIWLGNTLQELMFCYIDMDGLRVEGVKQMLDQTEHPRYRGIGETFLVYYLSLSVCATIVGLSNSD